MLNELHIRNFAIIDDLHLVFGPGLNILTGETGAGKSIIIDALGLLLGDRAAAEWVRAGSETAAIEATFQLTHGSELSAEVHRLLEEQGLDDPDSPDWLLLGREVRLNGRNICRVNGRSVSLQILGELADQLIDVHGQGEHLNLLQPKTHIHLLDRYANLLPLRKEVAGFVSQLRTVRQELQRLRQDARTMAQRVDLLSFQAEEIQTAQLKPGEDGELQGEQRRLGNAEALLKLAQTAHSLLNEGDGEAPCAVDLVGEAVGRLEKLARIDPDMNGAALDGQSLLEQLSDLARTLDDYAESLEFNPERLQEVEDRIELINNLKRKYGDTIEQINAFGVQAQKDLDELGNWEVKTADLEKQEETLLRKIGALGADLSARRKTAGEALARGVEHELADLRMTRARFGVAVEPVAKADGAYLPDARRVAFDSTGIDQVEFLISANPGEPLKPMAKVASGGETARLMLALKSVLTHADATPTLIFDEIDQGIGGRVGATVGQKLWMLTGNGAATNQNGATVQHQVLCITHLPQLAAFGDQHFTVNKQVLSVAGEERTSTVVRKLDDAARLEELVQMLGATGEAGRRSVQEMMGEASKVKLKEQVRK
ncbi:MAG: DNA repair protein RecN [Chloroflexota bacterium]|nr:DNA repair protein RecN [Chloroflexota bacterium]